MTLALLLQAASTLPADASALERAISALERDIKVLDTSSVPLERRLPWVTGIVAFGVAMELWVIWRERRDDMTVWQSGIIRPSDKPSTIKFVVEIVSVLLITGGIVGELWTGISITSINGKLRSKNAELRAASDQLVELLRKKAQDEALARVRIEGAVAWRSLTKQQQQEIGSGLRSRFPSKHIVQIICGAFDTEGSGFARDIAKALRNANFDVPPPESLAVTRTGGIRPTDPITNIPTGVKVASAPERESIALAQAIVNELTSRGFDASMERPYGKRDTTNADWSDISIDVQARPEGPQGEFKLEAEREAKAKDKDKTKAKAKPE